ncbi:MAG: NHL repeat-containing protein [Mariniblastus sp.]
MNLNPGTTYLSIGLAGLFCLATICGCLEGPTTPEQDIFVWGRRGLDDGRFMKPRAITIDEQDRLYIVDKTARVQVFDREGNFLHGWRMPEFIQGKPCGLSISQDGHLMVCDTHYFRLLFYTLEGELIEERTIGGVNGRGPGEFGFLTDAVQDSLGNIYISEYGDYDRIQKFTPSGDYVYEWGEHGEGPGQFQRPQGLAMDENDHLWVADASNGRIQIFDVSGNEPKFIRTWGKMGSEVGELSYPYEIILDGEGHVYVCEFGNHRIQKFDLNGKSLGTWGSAGKEPGQLHQPWAMCWDSERELHIVDTYNNRIQRFPSSQLGNSTLPVTAEK